MIFDVYLYYHKFKKKNLFKLIKLGETKKELFISQ